MRYSQLKDRQSPSFYIHKELADYVAVGVFAVHDMDIGDDQYTQELAPGLKNMARFMYIEYNDAVVSEGHIAIVKEKLKEHYPEYFEDDEGSTGVEKARQWLRDNTNLVETENGVFQIQEEDEEFGIEAKFITID